MSNRLKYEKSPYLLQHAENPVDWYPWCKEAFERAEKEACDNIDRSLPEKAAELLSQSFDAVNGGFGNAPKFPMPYNLIFLTLYSKYSARDGRAGSYVCDGDGHCSVDYKESAFEQVKVTLEN